MMTSIPTINIEKTGANLRKLIKDHGYTVKQVQDFLCLASNQALYSWFVGRNLPAVENLVALACLLNVTVDDLLVVDCPDSQAS